MSLGVYGFGCEDSLNHLLNYVWPNVFETSPHVIQAVMGALEGLRVALGPCRMLQYCLQVETRVRMWDVRIVWLERMVHRYVSLEYIRTTLFNPVSLCRVCSIRPGRWEMSTGRFTTPSTLVPRTPWLLITHKSTTMRRTSTSAMSSNMLCKYTWFIIIFLSSQPWSALDPLPVCQVLFSDFVLTFSFFYLSEKSKHERRNLVESVCIFYF